MKNRFSLSQLILLFATVFLLALFAGVAPLYAQVTWNRQAYGQGPFYPPGHEGDPLFAFHYPNNNNWSQHLTLSDPAHPPVYETAPSNWSTEAYPQGAVNVALGNGGVGQDNTPTVLDLPISINSLTIQSDGKLSMHYGTSLTANLFSFQGNNTNDATIPAADGGGAHPALVVGAGGTMKKTTGNRIFTLDPAMTLLVQQGGTVGVDSGTFQLPGTTSSYAGGINFEAASGALLDLAPANAVDSGASHITGNFAGINAGGTVRLSGGWLNTFQGSATFNFGGNTFQWTGGRIGSDAANPFFNMGTINIAGAVTAHGGGGAGDGFNNQGTMIQSGAGTLDSSAGNFINTVTGVYDIQNDRGITGDFNNAGIFKKTGGSGTSVIANVFRNTGTIIAASGTIQFHTGSGGFNQTGGVIDLEGGNVAFDGTQVDLNGGSLTGSGTINGTLRNLGGTVAPGHSPGRITFTGNYFQGSNGVLAMEIGGSAPGTGYDQIVVGGQATLGGTLNISLINGFQPQVGDVFPFILSGSSTGTFSTINTTGFTGQVNYSAGAISITILTVSGGSSPTPTSTPTATPTATPSQLLNIATRMRVQTGENVIIGGFIITGTDSKNVIIRGIGPSLAPFLRGALANPTLELFQGSTLLQSNNDWKDTQQIEIAATGLQPSEDLESAIVRTLPPGSYTAILRGLSDTTGIGVVQAYDLNQTANSKLANIATRGFVEAGDNVMIGGLIIGPAAGSTARVVVRAIGPSLTAFGIAGALQDPTVELKDDNGMTLSSNDDWQQGQPVEIQQLGLAPTNIHESALVTTLVPGSYTAIVRGVGNTTGVGLVEVYHVP